LPIDFEILKGVKIVLARAHGTLTADDMMSYQRTVWSDPNVIGYDEIVDVTAVESFAHEPNSGRARVLADLSAKMDFVNQSRKFAIVAADDAAFGLGQTYQTLREANPQSRKEVKVFRTYDEARTWLGR
jgi:hypothetical protein